MLQTANATQGSTSDEAGDCICDAGSAKVLGSCQLCPQGTYSASSNLTECTSCAPNSAGPAGSTAASDCECDPGFTGPDGGACMACPAGAYKEDSGTAACINCPLGTFSSVSAATMMATCNECPSNTVAIVYPATAQEDCLCTVGFEVSILVRECSRALALSRHLSCSLVPSLPSACAHYLSLSPPPALHLREIPDSEPLQDAAGVLAANANRGHSRTPTAQPPVHFVWPASTTMNLGHHQPPRACPAHLTRIRRQAVN